MARSGQECKRGAREKRQEQDMTTSVLSWRGRIGGPRPVAFGTLGSRRWDGSIFLVAVVKVRAHRLSNRDDQNKVRVRQCKQFRPC